MKKLILLFLSIINIGIAFSQTEVNSINIHINNDTITYFLSDIDSISHYENNVVSVYLSDGCYKYNVNNIDSICLAFTERHAYYQIPEESLEGWTEGCFDSNGCFIVYRQEESDGGYFAVIGEKGHKEYSIALKFDSDMNIQTVFSNRGTLNVLTDEDANKTYGLFVLKDSMYVKDLGDITKAKRRNALTRLSAGSALNTICGWVNNALTISDFGNLFSNGSGCLSGFLLGQGLTAGIWGYSNPVGLGLNLGLGWLEQQYEDNYNNILLDYMGTPMIWISNIDEEDAPDYKIEVSVKGVNTFGTPITCSLHSGVAVKVDDSHILYDNCDMNLNGHTIKGDDVYNATLRAEKGKTYYLRPYVVVMIDGFTQVPYTRQRYLWGGPKEPLIKYGDVQELKYEIHVSSTTGGSSDVTDKSATVECTYSGIPKGATCGVEYEANSGWKRQTTSSGNGTRSISLSGLEPGTTYTYRAYVEYDGEIYYAKNSKSFTTNPPDISGTWACKETYYLAWDKNYENPQYKTYSVTLNKDGSVVWNGRSDYTKTSWSYSASGKLTISITDIATIDFNSGFDVSFTANDAKNPTKLTGVINNWSFNDVVGYVSRGGNAVELTR